MSSIPSYKLELLCIKVNVVLFLSLVSCKNFDSFRPLPKKSFSCYYSWDGGCEVVLDAVPSWVLPHRSFPTQTVCGNMNISKREQLILHGTEYEK